MNNHPPRTIGRIISGFIFACLLILSAGAVNAQQGEGWAFIKQLDSSAFPQVSFILEAYNADGSPMENLIPASVQVIENGNEPAPVEGVETVQPGVQVILAYNLGPAMANVISTGEVRYEVINAHFQEYFNSLPQNTADDFSLATNTGLQSIRLDSPQDLADELAEFDPQLMQNQPNLTSLLQSLDLATDPNPDPLMKRAILYVTPQLNPTNMAAFPGLIDRAVQQDVQVFVWLVAPATIAQTNPTVVEPLQELAVATGGEFFLYSGQEDLPDPDSYLEPLRSMYRVNYRSNIIDSGRHRLTVRIRERSFTFDSNELVFSLDVQPPNIILLDPVQRIERTWETAGEGQDVQLFPQSQDFNFLVEYPDRHSRQLVRAGLYINDELVDRQETPPFDTLTWDLSLWDTTQTVSMEIEVEDSLGLTSRTSPLLVQLDVAEPPLTFWQSLLRLELTTERWIILGSVLATGAVLVLAVILAGKRRAFWREQSAAKKRDTDPLTQPVRIRQESPRTSSSNLYPKVNGGEVSAWLVPLDEDFNAKRGSAIPLNRPELVIGSDRKQAGLVLPSSAIEAVHARLTRGKDDSFRLADNETIAGTWVNYAPVSARGVRLQHGDLVHFGKIVYRFELSDPKETDEPQLISYNGKYDSR